MYNPYPSRIENSCLQWYKNPSSVCQPYMYLLKSERIKWNREIWTKMIQKWTVSPSIIFKYLQCALRSKIFWTEQNQLLFISYNPKSCLAICLLLLRFSQTCEFWSSKANWRLRFSLPSIILTDLLENKPLLKLVQKIMDCDFWLVDFNPFCEFLCFKVRLLWW